MNAAKEAKEANLNIKDGPRKIGMHSFLLEKKAHKTSRFNQVGSNLHNLKSLERLNVNKARLLVHPPKIIASDWIQDSQT